MKKRRMNAGRERGRIGMAWIHQDAGLFARVAQFDKELDAYLAKQAKEMDDVLKLALPALDKVSPGLGLASRLALEMNPLFGVTIQSPRRLAGIDTIPTGFKELDKEPGFKKGEISVFGGRAGVPAFMLPRDNGHRLSRDDRAQYDELCANNTYVPPQRKEDKWGTPEWPEGTELVSGRHPDAGEWGKLCYRTACQQPNAFYFNKGTRKHYCQECADIIDRENMIGEKLHTLAVKEGEHA